MATRPILTGTDEPQLQYWESSFSPATGSSQSKEFKGLSLAKMSAQAQSYAAGGWEGTLRYEHNIATLTLKAAWSNGSGGVTSPYNDITDKWELSVDQEKPDLCENGKWLAAIIGFDSSTLIVSQQILQCVRSAASGSDATWSGFIAAANAQKIKKVDGTPQYSSGTTQATVNYYLGLLGSDNYTTNRNFTTDYLRGANTYVRGKYVLRHTTSAPNNYSANVADFNVEKIYTRSQLLSEIQSTTYWILPCPAYLQYKIANYPVITNLPSNYMDGALKMRSNATLAARNRIEITTEYLIDAWPIHTYGTI